MENINVIAKRANIDEKYVEPYGKTKAKISLDLLEDLKDKKDGKLVLVTAITPTKAGEGKTTTSIALTEGLAKINQNVMLCLREPSLGPVFGIKGGATGGGLASIEPKDEINLHFTGDMHALTTSINLISAIIDNHIYSGNELRINPEKIVWKRALDMNDRALRVVNVALGDKNGTPRKDGFVITVASELMAILCLSSSVEDFKNRINKIIVAYDMDDNPIYLKQLRISNAIMKLMKEAFKPNLVQTLEGNPVLVHGGPFANIAHGCNSMLALKMAMKLGDITITEAGFGADLGAEKFLDILCPAAEVKPDGVVMVATIRALKVHGGADLKDSAIPNVDALIKGCANLEIHLENMKKYGLPIVVAINHFDTDSQEEIDAVERIIWENPYITEVYNYMTLTSNGIVDTGKDAWLSKAVIFHLIGEEGVTSSNYKTLVKNKIVYVLGYAESEKEKELMLQTLKNVSGLRRIMPFVIIHDKTVK